MNRKSAKYPVDLYFYEERKTALLFFIESDESGAFLPELHEIHRAVEDLPVLSIYEKQRLYNDSSAEEHNPETG